MMKTKTNTIFVCSNCGNEYTKWAGQCSGCKEWNTLKEITNYELRITNGRQRTRNKRNEIKNLGEIQSTYDSSFDKGGNVYSSNISEFDRVLGKGIVRGSVVLFAGEPGIGKSTLLTQLVGKVGGLYVAGEESAEQIGMRVKRLGLDAERFDVLETNSIEEIEEIMERTNKVFNLVVVDSIQTVGPAFAEAVAGKIGSINGIKETTFRLVQLAKKTRTPFFIVGHITKGGEIAGPKLMEHMVDTVLYFEGERNSDLRVLRVDKNRFGPTDEVGVFKMEEKGLREITSEEINLVSPVSKEASAGKTITIVLEGTRPMMIEIQALVTESYGQVPTRVFSGIDYNRGKLLVAVGQKILGMPLYKCDVYVSVTGGIRVDDTGCDLAVMGAMWSSYKNLPLTPSLMKEGEKKRKEVVLIGEVSLLGEVKKVRGMEKREKEAKAMGREMVKMENIRELIKN